MGEKCTDFEVEGVRTRGKPNKTQSEVIKKDCEIPQICKEDAMGRRKRKRLIKHVV